MLTEMISRDSENSLYVFYSPREKSVSDDLIDRMDITFRH